MSLSDSHKYFHWLYYKKGWQHLFNIGTGLFVWLFLLLTLPFGIYNNNMASFFDLGVHLLGIGGLWTACIYMIHFVADGLFRMSLQSKPNIDMKIWIVVLVVIVHALVIVRGWSCDWTCINTYEYLEAWMAVFLLFAMFYIPVSFYARSKYFKSLIGESAAGEGYILLQTAGKRAVRFRLDDVLYFKSDDNYVDIFFLKNKAMEKSTIRSSLKAVAEQLVSAPQFIQTHRSYLINMKYLIGREEPAALILGSSLIEDVSVPISKKYRDRVRKILSDSMV